MLEIFILWTPHLAVEVEDWRAALRPGRAPLAHGRGRDRGALLAREPRLRASRRPVPGVRRGSGPASRPKASAIRCSPRTAWCATTCGCGGELRVLVVSGSNMSGKSTMLRTLGINAVLAQAGAPVRARRLRLSPLAVGASIRVTDSLQGGVSRFYAEILRLRQILDLTARAAAGAVPDRRVPARHQLARPPDRRRGAGARPGGARRHRADHHARPGAGRHRRHARRAAPPTCTSRITIEDGQIRFDYVMRPGVVRKSNAIELMRSVGLEI